MKEWCGVILAGGRGSRMGKGLPKVLRPICGVPMIRLVMDAVREADITQTIVVVPPEHEDIQSAMPENTHFAIQHTQLGTGDALSKAMEAMDNQAKSHILVVNGDVPLLDSATISNLIEEHASSEAAMSLLTATGEFPSNLGSISRGQDGEVIRVIEGERLSSATAYREVNVGVYCFRVEWLLASIQKLSPSESGEFYVTDLVEIAYRDQEVVATSQIEDISQALGVNTLRELADADEILRGRIRDYWIDRGVYIMDRQSVHIDWLVTIGQGTTLLPNTMILGQTTIGDECEIGGGSMIRDSRMGDKCKVISSVIEGAIMQDSITVGPFSHLRRDSFIESGVHIGNYAEVKASRIGQGSKMGHFSYMGDAQVGANVNVGAGTITCNFDGQEKHQTIVGDDVFLGSDTMLVAPIRIGARAKTGAGAVVTKDVPADVLVAGVPARVVPKQS